MTSRFAMLTDLWRMRGAKFVAEAQRLGDRMCQTLQLKLDVTAG